MEKKEWLESLTNHKINKEAVLKKQLALGELWHEMDSMVEEQKLNWDIKMVQYKDGKPGVVGKKVQVLDYETRDQTEEFDLDEIQDGYQVASDGDLEKLSEAINNTERLVQKMKSMKDPEDQNKPMFTDEEIATEVYQPLVRRGILPETFVPDKFSQTRNTIDFSFEAYKERNKSEATKSFLEENFNLLASTAGMLFTEISVGFKGDMLEQGLKGDDAKPTKGQFTDGKGLERLRDAWSKDLNPTGKSDYSHHAKELANDFDLFATATDWVGTIEDAGISIRDNIRDNRNKKEELNAPRGQARLKLLPRIGQGIVSGLAAHLSKGFAVQGIDGNLCLMVGSLIGSLIKPQQLAKDLQGDSDNKGGFVLEAKHTEGVLTTLSGAIKTTFEACAEKIDTDAKDKLKNLGNTIASNFTSECTKEKLLKALTEKDGNIDPAQAINLVTMAVKNAVATSQTDLEDILKGQSIGKKVSEGLNGKMTAVLELEIKNEDEKARKEKQDFELALQERNAEALLTLIEKKTAVLKRDEAIIKWLCKIANMGIAQAAQAIAPLATVGSGLKMLQNGRAALKRGQDWIEFRHQKEHLFNAASEFSSPLANMVKNSGVQFAHYTFLVASEGLNIVGAALQCSGFGLAIGVGIQAGVKGAQALEAWMIEVEKRYNLGKAWSMYQDALRRPDNRKLALLAMRKNPTLAKYAVAYGAIIRKDPIVSDVLRYCGINQEAVLDLEGKVDEKEINTKLDKVVSYLEARMPDDISVLGRPVELTEWAPSPVELTLTCWAGAKKRAELKANLSKGVATKDIDVALTRFGASYPNAKLKQAPDHSDCLDALEALENAFKAYHPRMKDEKSKKEMDHGQMKHLVAEFLAEVNKTREELLK